MVRTLKITWDAPGGTAGTKVTAKLDMPHRPRNLAVLLAHGAGAPQSHPFMVALRSGLAHAGYPTMTFNYRYTELGRKAPDRLETLLAVHRAAADRLATYAPGVVLAGKSMGGRVASHLAGDDQWPCQGLIYYGYPLVAPGKREPRAVDHLSRISAAQLFLSGSRDSLAPLDLLTPVVAAIPGGQLVVIEDGDHSFKVPKKTGTTQSEVMERLVAESLIFLATAAN